MEGVSTTSVSVVIPVYNAENTIGQCLDSVLNQDLPDIEYEVIVVDNGSTDATPNIVLQYNQVQYIQSPISRNSYSARNAGIQQATGDSIVFTDADCTVDTHWLHRGITALNTEQTELVAGNIVFTYSTSPTAAEIYDSLVHMQQQRAVEQRNLAFTANLFVQKTVFEQYGLFPETHRSGGDAAFTANATLNGATLVFAPQAKVYHPARTGSELLKKAFRVGTGKTGTARTTRSPVVSRPQIQYLHPGKLARALKERSQHRALLHTLHIWLWGCLTLGAYFAGSAVGCLRGTINKHAVTDSSNIQ